MKGYGRITIGRKVVAGRARFEVKSKPPRDVPPITFPPPYARFETTIVVHRRDLLHLLTGKVPKRHRPVSVGALASPERRHR